MLEMQHHLQEMHRQIVEHRRRTNAEIHNDAYLTLMSLEEYVNPYLLRYGWQVPVGPMST